MLVTFTFNRLLKKRKEYTYNKPLKYLAHNFYFGYRLINLSANNSLPRIKRKLLVKFL